MTITTSVAVAIFLGLAIWVITRNSHQPNSWIFSVLCLAIATFYFSSLFMIPEPEFSSSISSFFLYVKWVAIALSPALYLHLVSFYFLFTWQQYRSWILLPSYFLSAGLASLILFTNLVVADLHHHSDPHIIGPTPGPLMPLLAGFFLVHVMSIAVGLIVSYRVTRAPSIRHQILYLIAPTGLVLLSSAIHWVIIIQDADQFPHEIPDVLLILAAFFYVRAVIHYGSFVGRPLTRRRLFYSILASLAGLSALYLTLALDRWLMAYTHFPFPPTTGILVITLITSFPAASRWIIRKLDGLLFRSEAQERELTYHLAGALVEIPDPERLEVELLDTLCTILNVRNGYVALSKPELSPDKLAVHVVHGDLALQLGSLVHRPSQRSLGKVPQLVSTFSPQLRSMPGWQDIILFCPLTIDQDIDGVLALGEKQDGTPFTSQEITLCAELAKHLNNVGRMIRLRDQRNHWLEAAREQEEALRELSEVVISSTRQTLSVWKDKDVPLKIRILGPLQVSRNGQIVPETTWGSEKAKALLAYLLWKSPTGVTREELSRALWPDRLFEETANVFHVTLHRLRRVLQPQAGRDCISDYIRHDRGRYCFNMDTPHWLDVTAFQEFASHDDPIALETAVQLYRGSYLEDVAWALPPDVEAQQRQLEQLYADILRRLAAQAKGRETTIYLEKLIAVEPADETAYRALVLGYLAQGRRDLARRQIARWQQALVELELEPTVEVRALWHKVGFKTGH